MYIHRISGINCKYISELTSLLDHNFFRLIPTFRKQLQRSRLIGIIGLSLQFYLFFSFGDLQPVSLVFCYEIIGSRICRDVYHFTSSFTWKINGIRHHVQHHIRSTLLQVDFSRCAIGVNQHIRLPILTEFILRHLQFQVIAILYDREPFSFLRR